MKKFLETTSFFFAIGVLILLVVICFIYGNNDIRNSTHSPAQLEQQIVLEDVFEIEPEEAQDAPIFVDTIPLDSENNVASPDQEEIYPVIELGRVEKYYNKQLEYGFLMPYGNYYSGFGPQDGAIHSVGISGKGVPETLSDAQVQVLYYGVIRAEIPKGQKIWDSNNTQAYKIDDTIYVRILDEYDIQILGDIDSDTAQAIVQTLFIGSEEQLSTE